MFMTRQTLTKSVSKEAVENSELLTASKPRHCVSTIYCALNVPDNDMGYKHMGQ